MQQVPNFGAWLQAQLHQCGYSRADFLDKLRTEEGIEVSIQAVSYWLRGNYRPRYVHLMPICRVVDGKPAELLAALAHERAA